MNMHQRRNFLKALGVTGAGLLLPQQARAATRPEGVPVPTGAYGHVLVVGGGMGGRRLLNTYVYGAAAT